MDNAGSELMLINKHNYKRMVDILVQLHMRGKLAPDESEFLKGLVDFQ
jgi:hypothetical protein